MKKKSETSLNGEQIKSEAAMEKSIRRRIRENDFKKYDGENEIRVNDSNRNH